ncbi:MAG: cysteine desulfurase NifS [Eubacteriales bacterium]|nr:cysteine desulfurase NifS [Eubacteriales bacterium]
MIYLDNAATTAVKPEVLEAMMPYFIENYSNPSSVYSFAQESHNIVDEARDTLAALIHAKGNEIYFTGGGSEADNWALKAAAAASRAKGKHIITSKIEHHAVLHTCEFLEKQGFDVTYLDVDENGLISPEELERAIRPDTILISIMFANNEIGTIEPVKELAETAHRHGVIFHTDAVQAFGHVPINVEDMNIDMLSASGHKFHGPKGIGFLYVSNRIKIGSLIHGGAQERGKRAGTLNVPGIVGMSKAASIAYEAMSENIAKEIRVRDHFIDRISKEIPFAKLNGDRIKRLSNNVNFSLRFVEGESVLIMLDQKGICASSGSACTSGSLDPSHVLLAIGLPHEIAHGSLRITISEDTTIEDADYTVDVLKVIIERLRNMSPLYEDFVRQQAENKL